jgi:hypothetical protein
MLIVGYCFGVRSERRLCDEVHLNLAYRWFCRLGLDGDVPDHSTFPRTATAVSVRAISFANSLRPVVGRCIKEGVVGGEAFAVDARMIVADVQPRGRRVSFRSGRRRLRSGDAEGADVDLADRSRSPLHRCVRHGRSLRLLRSRSRSSPREAERTSFP